MDSLTKHIDKMKRVYFIFSISIIVLFTGNLQGQEPYFHLRNLNNEWKQYEDIKGDKLTVIDFWATWCQPCIRSIPELNTLSEEFKDQGVNFVGISIDGPRNQSKIQPFVKSLGIGYTILKDINSELMTDMNVTSVPTLLLINSEGDVVYMHEGFRPGDEDVIREEINNYL